MDYSIHQTKLPLNSKLISFILFSIVQKKIEDIIMLYTSFRGMHISAASMVQLLLYTSIVTYAPRIYGDIQCYVTISHHITVPNFYNLFHPLSRDVNLISPN
jgi:hypothetical protein